MTMSGEGAPRRRGAGKRAAVRSIRGVEGLRVARLMSIADSSGSKLKSNSVVTSIAVQRMRGLSEKSHDDFVGLTAKLAVGGVGRGGVLLIEHCP